VLYFYCCVIFYDILGFFLDHISVSWNCNIITISDVWLIVKDGSFSLSLLIPQLVSTDFGTCWYQCSLSNFTHVTLQILKCSLLLYMFFWVFPRRQYVVCRRFGTMYQFHLQRL
jgi:hypothetical protein